VIYVETWPAFLIIADFIRSAINEDFALFMFSQEKF